MPARSLLLLLLSCLAGCGQTGPLYLPQPETAPPPATPAPPPAAQQDPDTRE